MTNKKELGAFYTTEVNNILDEFTNIIKNKNVIDLYCGDRHLLNWATQNGAKSVYGYDVSNKAKADKVQDTLMSPPKLNEDDFILINPPYLLRNKSKNKAPFDKWKTTDLYKASILSLIASPIKEAIIIIPYNILVDNDDTFRNLFYNTFHITKLKKFNYAVFKDTGTRVIALHIKRGITSSILGHSLINTRVGIDWFHPIKNIKSTVSRLRIGDKPNSNINLRATDTGTLGGEIRLEIGDHYYGKNTDRNLATLVFQKEYTLKQQKIIINKFNKKININRKKYDSMFLTNFLNGKDGVMRKRVSFRDVYKQVTLIAETMK